MTYEIEFKVTGLDEQSYNSIIELLKTIKKAEIVSSKNDGKPLVSGSLLPTDKIWLLKEVASSYIYETAEEGTYSIATQGIEKILEYYELHRRQ